jgi:hypothetical protein
MRRGASGAALLLAGLSARAWAQEAPDTPPPGPAPPTEITKLPDAPPLAPADAPLPPAAEAHELPDLAPRKAPPPPPRPIGQLGGAAAAIAPDDSLFPHYDKGFVIVPTRDPEHFPFRLKLNHVSQFKYSNTMAVNETFTDHLGRQRDVLRRNDIQLTRDVFYFSGFAFDTRLDFNVLIYTSSATLSATAAGYVGYVFGDAFALRAGFFSLPSMRAMTGTYPYFPGTDRSMAVNYFRPGFTQGVWANGEPLPGFNYIAMVGNSLNTLDIAASKIDFNLAYAATVWYDRNDFGLAWNDYEHHDKPALRLGASFTFAREDRLSDLSTSSPENNATWISDGTLLFETGALAPNVTVSLANVYIAAIDAGIKWRGLAFNAELYQRWLNRFDADGPLPLSSIYDWGFESSLGYFLLRSKLETYLRGSFVKGSFRNSGEGAVGFKFYPFRTRGVWIDGELIAIKNSPFGSVLYIYSAGQTGFLVPVQFLVRF